MVFYWKSLNYYTTVKYAVICFTATEWWKLSTRGRCLPATNQNMNESLVIYQKGKSVVAISPAGPKLAPLAYCVRCTRSGFSPNYLIEALPFWRAKRIANMASIRQGFLSYHTGWEHISSNVTCFKIRITNNIVKSMLGLIKWSYCPLRLWVYWKKYALSW